MLLDRETVLLKRRSLSLIYGDEKAFVQTAPQNPRAQVMGEI